jgi:hypothetical protein
MIWAKTLLASFLGLKSPVLAYESSVRVMLKKRTLAVIVIIVAAALGGGIMTFAIGLPASPCAGIAGTTRNFTIVASVNGFNDSVNHQQGSWPVMTVHRCDIVKVTIINSDTQTHGFAVDYYATRGTEIQGGQTLPVPPFLASKTGQFRVFCISFCTIHAFMQNGLLNVA